MLTCAAALALSFCTAGATLATEGASYDRELLGQLGTRSFEVFSSRGVEKDDGPELLTLQWQGERLKIDLAPTSARSSSYTLRVVGDKGERVVDPGPVLTRQGVVRGHDGSVVTGVWLPEGFRGTVRLGDGDILSITPLLDHVPGAPLGLQVIHDPTSVPVPELSFGDCTLGHVMDHNAAPGIPLDNQLAHAGHERVLDLLSGAASECEGGPFTTSVLVDTDYEFFTVFGRDDVMIAQAIVEEAILEASSKFELGPGFSIEIDEVILRTSPEVDPYEGNTARSVLDEANNQHSEGFLQRDISTCYVISGRDFSSPSVENLLGLAFLNGAGKPRFGYAMADGQAIAVSRLGLVVAHELGHNWGASHCDLNVNCEQCGFSSVMRSNLGLPTAQFEECSVQEMLNGRIVPGLAEGFLRNPFNDIVTVYRGFAGSGDPIAVERGVIIRGESGGASEEFLMSVESPCPTRPEIDVSFGELPITTSVGDLRAPGQAWSIRAKTNLAGSFTGTVSVLFGGEPLPSIVQFPLIYEVSEGDQAPGAFELESPRFGEVFTLREKPGLPIANGSARFAWSSSNAARRYTLVITPADPGGLSSNTGDTIVFEIDDAYPTQRFVSLGDGRGAVGEGVWSWFVRAHNANGTTTSSQSGQFTVEIIERDGGSVGNPLTDDVVEGPAAEWFNFGDVNLDGRLDIADAVSIIRLIGETAHDPLADLNRDGAVSAADVLLVMEAIGSQVR